MGGMCCELGATPAQGAGDRPLRFTPEWRPACGKSGTVCGQTAGGKLGPGRADAQRKALAVSKRERAEGA